MSWQDDQKWEAEWHSNCANSYWEETKQNVYAKRMGLVPDMVLGKYPVFDLQGKSVIDIGGGPYSLLLKCVNFSKAVVVDPCDYPKWTKDRYEAVGIEVIKETGEKELEIDADEIWIYNCLQHTINPQEIIANAKRHAKVIRIFEWIDCGTSIGHPHELHEESLNEWFSGFGKVETLNESGCYGKAYYGIFPT